MIRADWTPLWGAGSSNRTRRIGHRQAELLTILRDHGPLTLPELRSRGVTLAAFDSLCTSGGGYPMLVMSDRGSPLRYCLAAPSQQAELDAALAVVAAHPGGIHCNDLPAGRWRDAVIDHLANTGIAGYRAGVLYPSGRPVPVAPHG